MKTKKNFVKAIVAIAICSMLTIGLPMSHTNASATVTQEELNLQEIDALMESYDVYIEAGPNFYQCMIMCGVPYLIIITALAFSGDGMGFAQALALAGATAAMIACVLTCLGSGGGSSFEVSQDCDCHLYHRQLNEEK